MVDVKLKSRFESIITLKKFMMRVYLASTYKPNF